MARILTREEQVVRRIEPVEPPREDLRPLVDGMIRAIQSIKFPAPQVQVTSPASLPPVVEVAVPEPIREWVFEVKRNKDGYIQTVTATAK